MLISTVVAVALGVAPIGQDNQVAGDDYSDRIGRYSQIVDRRGTTHLRGHDHQGVPYDLVMDRKGFVEGSVGDGVIAFRIKQRA